MIVQRTCRRGMTFTEVLMVMGILGMLLSGTSVAMLAMFRADLGLRGEMRADEGVSRLSLRFRQDAHAATGVTMNADGANADADNKPGGPRLSLSLPGGETIEYRARAGEVQRTVRRGEKVVHRDAFRIGDGLSAAWDNASRGDRRFVVLVLQPEPRGGTSADSPVDSHAEPAPLRVETALGEAALAKEPGT